MTNRLCVANDSSEPINMIILASRFLTNTLDLVTENIVVVKYKKCQENLYIFRVRREGNSNVSI